MKFLKRIIDGYKQLPLAGWLVIISATIVFAAAGVGITTWATFTTFADGDLIAMTDVSDTSGSDDGTSKTSTWANFKAQSKAYFDTLYGLIAGTTTVTGDWTFSGIVDLGGSTLTLPTSARAANTIGTFTVPTTTNPYAFTAANLYNSVLWYGATGEIDLAAGVDGMTAIIYNTGAFTVTVDPNASEVIVVDGTAQTGGVSFTLSSGAGNFVSLVFNGTQWVTMGFKGTLAEGT